MFSLTSNLKLGSSGPNVLFLSRLLDIFGYPCNVSSELLTEDISAAIKAFQKDHGLKDDGIFGSLSYQVLKKKRDDLLLSKDHLFVSFFPKIKSGSLSLNASKTFIGKFYSLHQYQIDVLSIFLCTQPSVLAAVFAVESAGEARTSLGPVIRFETHKFSRYYTGSYNHYYDALSPKASMFKKHFSFDSKEPWKDQKAKLLNETVFSPVHTNQEREYKVFEFAKSLDKDAAYMSISMGMPQIMGFNHKVCGFDSAEEMFNAFSKGPGPQLIAFANFILSTKALTTAVNQIDFLMFATVYNGSGQAKAYAERMSNMYKNAKNIGIK